MTNKTIYSSRSKRYFSRKFENGKTLVQIARDNTFRLIAVLFLQEIFWFICNRIINGRGWDFYSISDFNTTIFLLMSVIAILFLMLTKLFTGAFSKFLKVRVGYWFVRLVFSIAIVGNAISSIFLTEGARYSEGGLTGAAGLIYAVAKTATIMSMSISIRGKYGNGPKVGLAMLLVFVASVFVTIDGLATALTICMFLFVMMNMKGGRGHLLVALAVSISLLILYVGFWAKFSQLPSYITPEFSFHWVVARMSITSESLYKFLSGDSMFNGSGAYIDVLKHAYYDRYQIITGNSPLLIYPRSVSEGFYMDMFGVPGAGSSPGFYLGVILHGLFSPLILLIFVWVFTQFFYGFGEVLSYPRVYALSFVLKIIHSNITEYLIIFSPVLIVFVGFIFSSIIEVKPRRPSTSHELIT